VTTLSQMMGDPRPPIIDNNPTCEIVTTYTNGSKKPCTRPIDFRVGDFPHPQVRCCRRHLATAFDLVHAQEPDENHIDVFVGRIEQVYR
jgi:hypothetical protein